jgi:DHA1 family bicyclomycin/chloramphenicol resistance-like MFS transporter
MLLSFGASQMVWGPLSDKFGRRPILLWGMGIYIISCIASVFAPTINWLIMARIGQGIAVGAAVMCSRAIIRDLYAPIDGTKIMSKALSGLGVLACAAPLLGGYLTEHIGWQGPMIALVVFGLISWLLVFFQYQESCHTKNQNALQINNLLSTWKMIITNRTFLTYCALSACSYSLLLTYLSSSSFVFIKIFGWTRAHYGVALFINAVFYIGGTFFGRQLMSQFGFNKTLAWAGVMSLLGSTVIGLCGLTGHLNPYTVILPFGLIMVAHGIHQPLGQASAVGPFPSAAGTAAALNGFIMMLLGFFIIAILGLTLKDNALPLAYGAWFWGTLLALVAFTLGQKPLPSQKAI